ncbi:MAG TPA: hypothetical protein VIL34_09650 [Actinopolymorphaceae bacterium]|jgi:hypothetical protein
MRKSVNLLGSLAALAVLTAACAGTDTTTDTTSDAASSQEGITVMSPKDGASVSVPFTLRFDAGDIGPEETGKDHVHVFVDGQENDYQVVTENQFKIDGLSEGEHTITITKQHADHSPTGEEAELTVNVTNGSVDTSGGGTNERPDYGY